MKNLLRFSTIFIALVVFIFARNSLYTVSEGEQVIITQFGKPIGEPITNAGLKIKIPFVQQINVMDKRVLEWDGRPSYMPTKDNFIFQ